MPSKVATRETQFFLVYSGIVAFQYHPGVKSRLTPSECLAEAYRYMAAFERAMKDGEPWLG